ncbi:FTR1 family iron permease [Noviherbaspirillum denitrificans]|uniref:Iron permease n=1 Tax=Noviherbaspirillum denitrificans TaxID=1968433 RepID=A0A254TEE3_9BURK|nr:FTR1 family protein [Noviherbaspirillum denitrificans]OWW20527.1 iron permease [Noviherbaspirillum denitrificans]
MLGSAIIVFREVLEAALIIGIIAAATRTLPRRNAWITSGIVAGSIGSVIVAVLTGRIAEMAEGMGQELFNALILSVAGVMLAWHNIWMARHGMQLARNARQLGSDVASGSREMPALALVIMLAILREGSETALFLYGILAGGQDSRIDVIVGGGLGLVAGSLAGYGLYAGFVNIPARLFFASTSGLILLMASAMFSQVARFLVQADVLPSLANPLWNSSWLIDNNSLPGRFLHTLVGYDAMPSGIQMVFYVTAMLLILTGMRLSRPIPSTSTP